MTYAKARKVRTEHIERWLWDGLRLYLAVRSYHAMLPPVVSEPVRERLALEELHVRRARLGSVVARQVEHLRCHVQAIDVTGGTDALGGQQHVDAAARAQVEDGLARVELSEGGRIATAQ